MQLRDWKYEAEQYRDLDQAVMAKIEAENAVKYLMVHGRYPELLSDRAWHYLNKHESELARQLPARNEQERESGRRTFR